MYWGNFYLIELFYAKKKNRWKKALDQISSCIDSDRKIDYSGAEHQIIGSEISSDFCNLIIP